MITVAVNTASGCHLTSGEFYTSTKQEVTVQQDKHGTRDFHLNFAVHYQCLPWEWMVSILCYQSIQTRRHCGGHQFRTIVQWRCRMSTRSSHNTHNVTHTHTQTRLIILITNGCTGPQCPQQPFVLVLCELQSRVRDCILCQQTIANLISSLKWQSTM